MGIKLLDCTLRDGGYINDWKFGYRTAKKHHSKAGGFQRGLRGSRFFAKLQL